VHPNEVPIQLNWRGRGSRRSYRGGSGLRDICLYDKEKGALADALFVSAMVPPYPAVSSNPPD